MKEKRVLVLTLSVACTLLVFMGAVNYWVDYYGVFHGIYHEVKTDQINDRYVKMEYLLVDGNYKKYDSFLWGSSRVKKMDPSATGMDTYNLGETSGLPHDCLQELSFLLEKGCKPKAVFLGLDDISYQRNWKTANAGMDRTPYSESLMDRGMYFWKLAMNSKTAYSGLKLKFKDNHDTEKTFLRTSGMYLVPKRVEDAIEKNPESYVKAKKFHKPIRDRANKKVFRDCMNTVKKIKTLCDQNGIRLVLFFNPLHMTTYMANDIQEMNQFKKELVKISPFWDFSGVNYVTVNNYFWYETSHPRAFICDKILDIVSGQHRIPQVPDFGVYVAAENVDAFCEKAVRAREGYDPKHDQWIPTPEERAVMTKRIHYPW